MNYRHIYHAGNVCDVVKHTTLVLLLEHLRQKDKGFCVLDTHAGVGLYNLTDERADKTAEAEEGIQRLWPQLDQVAAIASYAAILKEMNRDGLCRLYPGSPSLIKKLLRPQDRLVACELHPEDQRQLYRLFLDDPQVQVHARDGYEALQGLVPFEEKRGLVLIDPPYEQPDEFEKLTETVVAAYKKWPSGVYGIWYPIKERPALWRWHESLISAGISKMLSVEFIFHPEVRADRLNGSGMLIINPPWQFDEKVKVLFPALHKALNTEHQGSVVKFLVD